MANICFMNRKMNTIDSKISALLKSQMMKWLEFRKLVTKVDRFFYDHKLCELMKKKHSRKVNVVDHKFDFYSILLELLYEVHRNDPYEQPKLFEKVLEWHHTNQVKLKLMGSASDYNSTVGKDSRLQPCDHICTDENAVCPSVTMVKSTESKQIKKPEIPENAARPKTFPGSRTLTEQYNPTDGKPIESFRSFCERNLHLQGSSQRKCPQNPFFKRKATLNLHDVLHATNAISAKIELTTRKKRAQSVPPYQSRAVSNVTEKNRQQTSVPHSAKGGKIYHDWRGLISQESSRIYSVAEVSSTPQRAWSQKKVLKRQKQSAPQGDGQKALDSILHQNDTAGQKGTVAGIPGINRWKNVAVESPENESVHSMEKDIKKQGVFSANFPDLSIDQGQDANMLLKQKYSDSADTFRKQSEMGGQSLCNSKKTDIASIEIPDQSEEMSKANSGQVTTFENSFDSHDLIYQNSAEENKYELNKSLKVRAHFNERAMYTVTTTNKKENIYNMEKRDYNAVCTSPINEKENIFLFSHDNCTYFHSRQNDETFKECIPETSYDEENLTFTSQTGQYSLKFDQGQHVPFSLLKPIYLRECTETTFDYQQTMHTIQMSVLGHRLQLKDFSKLKVGKYPNLAKDNVKSPVQPAHSKKEQSSQTIKPSKAGRLIAMHFQPEDTYALAKASELQRRINAAVNIHEIFSADYNQQQFTEYLQKESEKYLDRWEKQLQLKRQQQLYSKNLFTIYNRPINIEMKARQKQLLMEKIQREVERKIDIERYERHLQNYNAARTGRIQSSRPHTDIFDAIHTKKTGPTPYERKMATIFLQKFIRGWLVRVTCDRIKSKALEHGASLSAVVRQYRRMMSRLRKRFHAPQQSISLVWSELEDWLDQKKKYEDMFAKRQFWKEINVSELPTFFQDCDHYPSPREINQTWALINSDGHFNPDDQ
uniref:uncharacterized protein isoform X3 n=1 Tax=Pristiophorus japonicus TaxID=55135 RepID=UPI00398F628F